MSRKKQITVMFSTKKPDRRTNPYITQLCQSLPENVQLRFYSMRDALFSRYDVLHIHWPEYMLYRQSRKDTFIARIYMLVLVAKLIFSRTPIVRTIHNLTPHEDHGWTERTLLTLLDHMTKRWIRINPTTPERLPATDTILMGHYVNWFAGVAQVNSIHGRLLYFGLVRPYKGVDTLLKAFLRLEDNSLSLRIIGNPSTPELHHQIEHACLQDKRVTAELAYVDEMVLAQEVMQAELIVLPYLKMHNSGSLLLALSLDRPVLAPWTETNATIQEEVGAGWVQLYRGELNSETLRATINSLRNNHPIGKPDLSLRSWKYIGKKHYLTYLKAIMR